MKTIPIGAKVMVFMGDQFFRDGFYLGKELLDQMIIFDPSPGCDHPVASYRSDQVFLKNSRQLRKRADYKILDQMGDVIFGKKGPEDAAPGSEWFIDESVKPEFADPGDWTSNFIPGQELTIKLRGEKVKIKVVTEFRNWVVIKYLVGTTQGFSLDTFKDKGTALLAKLSYSGTLKLSVLDLETLKEAVDD